MDNQLFRQKSLERISSPEDLHNYMRVTSPRLWMILSVIVVLLIGFIVYASTATMENTMPIQVEISSDVSDNGQTDGSESAGLTRITASLPLSQKDIVSTGMTVRIGDETGHISYISMMQDTDDAIRIVIEPDQGFTFPPDGKYDAVLVLESSTPIKFLWN